MVYVCFILLKPTLKFNAHWEMVRGGTGGSFNRGLGSPSEMAECPQVISGLSPKAWVFYQKSQVGHLCHRLPASTVVPRVLPELCQQEGCHRGRTIQKHRPQYASFLHNLLVCGLVFFLKSLGRLCGGSCQGRRQAVTPGAFSSWLLGLNTEKRNEISNEKNTRGTGGWARGVS